MSLSTNNIEKISSLSGMDNLQILSLGRNQIKKIENLDGVADTLEELWLSYNLLEKLVWEIFPLHCFPRLSTVSNVITTRAYETLGRSGKTQ